MAETLLEDLLISKINEEDKFFDSFSDNFSDNNEDDNTTYTEQDNNEDFNHSHTSLFKGTNKSTEEFISRFLKIKLKGEVSDNTSEKFLKLFCDFLPSGHNCPRTMKGIRNRLAYSVPDINNIFRNTIEHNFDNGCLLEFPFMELMELIIKRNLKNKLKNKLYSISYKQENEYFNFYYRIKIETITGDIPTLRKINNLKGCNGSYGCTYCFHKGEYIKTGEGAGQGKMAFNNGTKMTLKTMIEYERYATLLENIPREIMFGMLGKSHIDGIIQIPIDIAIDYMHTVLLEPIKEDMTSIRDGDKKMYSNGFKLPKMTKNMIDFFDHSLKLFILPREYKKNMKSLKEFGNFKAIEWKFFMLYGFPTIFLESMKNRINEFVVLQLSIISGIGLLMMDDINENELKMSENLLSLWFDERVRIIGSSAMKLKSHMITYLHAIKNDFTKTETNSLNQIKKRFQDFHMACYTIGKEEKTLDDKFIQIPSYFYNIFKDLFFKISQYKFGDRLYFKEFTIRASINGMIDRDNFLIVKIEKTMK
ncbi:Hypothetical protein SRAE_0000050900 [Strongyloides ratti]|uniref:Uncharacterized protein n=1 Tax=Strongyloides ratti TaxID=34506 RepID=A0A090L1M3_STRRB|nr:Hypothetical protein SRAE_0000050900 [Strongyloides ratti]CEF61384.1 Hypothetical protein SRAE_0000050900 [Strongyloides ratti]